MVRSALALIVGACSLYGLHGLPAWGTTATVLGVGVALALASRHHLPLLLVLGFGWSWVDTSERLHDRLDPALEGRNLALHGTVASVPQLLADGLRFQFAPAPAPGVPRLVELTWYQPDFVPKAAERVSLVVRMRRPRGFANPGGVDQEARMLRAGIGATGYVRSGERTGRDWRDVLESPVLVARGAIADAIRAALGERPATGIVAGLAVGLQDALSQQQWRQLARSGTSHLMAISGMHIGMFAAVAGWSAARLQRWRQRRGSLGAQRDVAVLAGTLAAYGYSLLAGWSVPTQRTMIMIALVALALRLRRRVAPGDALALGAIAVLALDPLAPLAPGFWLSFGAVAAILLATAGCLGRARLLGGFARTQLAVTAGLVPVLVGSFGNVSLVSALANAIAIPLYTLVVVPALLVATAVTLVFPAPGAVALRGVAWLIEFTWPVIAEPASWHLATWGVASLPLPAWIALVIGAVAAIVPLPLHGRVAGASMVVALCAWRPAAVAPGAVHFTLLDVGQGLASVVETRHHVLLFDTGPMFRSGTDTGTLVVEPFLRSRGVRHVDLLVASHDDNDHGGGSASVARLARTERYAASGHLLDRLGHVDRCRAGEHWTWDGVDFRWLHPSEPLLPGDNARSCVLLVRAGTHLLLLTGDIDSGAEAQMLGRASPGAVEVVVVPHHGSRSSSSQEFVSATAPRWALISAGYRNRWAFPAPAVVARWSSSGARIVETASAGAVEFDMQPGLMTTAPGEWRREHRRLWQDP